MQYQINGIHTGVNLGATCSSGVQEESDRRRGNISGEEDKQGKLRGLRGYKGGILHSPPHGEFTCNIPATEQGGRRWGRKSGDICGVLSADFEVGGVLGKKDVR